MKLRAELIREILARVEAADWTQAETAKRLGITQPRVSDLLSGKLSKFSLDALVNILAAMGSEVKLKVVSSMETPPTADSDPAADRIRSC